MNEVRNLSWWFIRFTKASKKLDQITIPEGEIIEDQNCRKCGAKSNKDSDFFGKNLARLFFLLMAVLAVAMMGTVTVILLWKTFFVVTHDCECHITSNMTTRKVFEITAAEKMPYHDENLFNASNETDHITYISRMEWVATPPKGKPKTLRLPVPYVILTHTASRECSTTKSCAFQVRHVQMLHMKYNGWYDIGYNFLIGGNGNVFVGRGWQFEGAHTYGFNYKSIGIAFIGNFENNPPQIIALDVCQKLIEEGIKKGYIERNYKLLTAGQMRGVSMKALDEQIRKFPHWSSSA